MFLDSYRFLQDKLSNIAKSLDSKDLKTLGKYFDINIFKEKGIYPYKYITSIEVLNETKLPPIEAFYSTLYNKNITEEEYKHSQNVWTTFNCKNFIRLS